MARGLKKWVSRCESIRRWKDNGKRPTGLVRKLRVTFQGVDFFSFFTPLCTLRPSPIREPTWLILGTENRKRTNPSRRSRLFSSSVFLVTSLVVWEGQKLVTGAMSYFVGVGHKGITSSDVAERSSWWCWRCKPRPSPMRQSWGFGERKNHFYSCQKSELWQYTFSWKWLFPSDLPQLSGQLHRGIEANGG